MSTAKPIIEVKNVTKKFTYRSDRPNTLKSILVNMAKGKFDFGTQENFNVLENVSFSILPGEFVAIMGPNGGGKSTILRMLCGIYHPNSGSISVNDSIAPMIELGAGMHEDLSGMENIYLNAAILGFGRKATLAAIDQILEFSELGKFIHMPTRKYSSGMLVRLGFSIATHLEAPIFLADEILAVGDYAFQQKCLKKIKELHSNGRTVVLVTHDPGAVREHCKRCIVINNKKIIFDGNPREGSDRYIELFNKKAPASTEAHP